MSPIRSVLVALGATLALGAPVLGVAEPAQARATAVPVFGDCTPGGGAGLTDFDGDGSTDAVVGDPNATVNGQSQAGRVIVLYGDDSGRVGGGGVQVVTQADLGQTPEAGDQFGYAVGTGLVDIFDACADVVVGAPGETLSGQADAGEIHVIAGSTTGLDGDDTHVTLTQADLAGSVSAGDRFGASVTAGDYLGQDTSIVAAGAPGEDVGGQASAGAVNLAQFQGIAPPDAQDATGRQITQDTPGVPGAAEAGDRFGLSLASGLDLLEKLHGWELVVGAPGEDVGTLDSAGGVTVLSEAQGYPPTNWIGHSVALTQDSPGVPGPAEAGDRFGQSLAVGNSDSYQAGSKRRVAVGAPGEDVGTDNSAGVVDLFTASGSGLVAAGSVSQDTAGVGGASEPGDLFGSSLAMTSGSSHRLAVGIPGESIGSVALAGQAQVFDFDHVATDAVYDQDSPGAAGVVHAGSRYGLAVGVVEGGPERVFAIGNPYNGTGTVHVLPVSGGFGARSWVPGAGGVPAGAARFGWSLGSGDVVS